MQGAICHARRELVAPAANQRKTCRSLQSHSKKETSAGFELQSDHPIQLSKM
jgi:hypothetical protein